MVGTMLNLVNEVLQSAVGNYFRNALQQLEAVRFIHTRHEVQEAAMLAVTNYLAAYEVETRGVYIQDVTFPEEMVRVLTSREIANQERATFEEQQRAQIARIDMEKAKGTADMQSSLASSQVGITIKQNEASARKAQAEGEAGAMVAMGDAEASRQRAIAMADADATRAVGTAKADAMRAQGEAQANTDRQVGLAQADAIRAQGLAQADGFEAQKQALGEMATALVNVVEALARGEVKVMPDVLVTGGAGGPFDGLAAVLTKLVQVGQVALPPRELLGAEVGGGPVAA
jgi:uncharacterized membrane protein YqiK